MYKWILLEQYEDTGRGESCLVAGYTKSGKPVHIVCGRREEISRSGKKASKEINVPVEEFADI